MKKKKTYFEQSLSNLSLNNEEIKNIINNSINLVINDHPENTLDEDFLTLDTIKKDHSLSFNDEINYDNFINVDDSYNIIYNSNNDSDNLYGSYFVNKFFPEENITLDVQLITDNISILKHDGFHVEIYQKGIKSMDNYHIAFDNNTLSIACEKKENRFQKLFKNSTVYILIPNKINIKKARLNIISADVFIDKCNSNSYDISCNTGNVIVKNSLIDTMKVEAKKGDIIITTCVFDCVKISSVSGDVKIDSTIVERGINTSIDCGDCIITNTICDNVSHRSISGDFKGQEFYPNKVSIDSISGDIVIKNTNKNHIITIEKKLFQEK